MCFSLEADLVAGAALLPVAAVSLREVRHLRELPFASLWCIWAALSSIFVMVHMVRRRHLSDRDRIHGQPPASIPSAVG